MVIFSTRKEMNSQISITVLSNKLFNYPRLQNINVVIRFLPRNKYELNKTFFYLEYRIKSLLIN